MRRAVRACLMVLVVLSTSAQSPVPTPQPPVFEIHRTTDGSHRHPGPANPLFVMVIGSDIREGDPRTGRADGLHIVAVNASSGHGTIVGIPRDSWLPIPGRGHDKINAALHHGGPELVVETVRQLSGLPIHYWVTIEFSRFRELVDRLGGITVDVPYPMADPFSGAFFEPGIRHMNGHEALAFSRNRRNAPGGDFGRQENIGRVLIAGLDALKARSEGPLGLLEPINAFRDLVVSDVPISDLLQLGAIARRTEPSGLQNIVLPGSTGSAGGQSVVFLSPAMSQIFDAIRDDAVL